MANIGDDCHYFYTTGCHKGPACRFRHVEEARGSDVTCPEWRLNRCLTVSCPRRHAELQPSRQNTPCFFETQPGGCMRPDCEFQHNFPRSFLSQAPPTTAVIQAPIMSGPPPHTVRPSWSQPPHRGPPPLHARPPVHPPPWGIDPTRPPPVVPPGPGVAPPFRHFPPRHEEPFIISLNSEESDQESIKGASPMKARTVVSSKTDNPLDYFLNAKPWVDPSTNRRSPSPQYRRRESPSPVRRSLSPVGRPRPGSQSPEGGEGRRRSVSVDRHRRRSHSLDRSTSPEWRDRRRFARRSRSPERRRSRSPVRGGGGPVQDLRSRLRPVASAPKLSEVKITGSKIISIKKDKKEEEAEKKEDVKPEPEKKFEEEPVKSLEEIYRERALLSLMEAKKKKILENKRKRWESLKQPEKKTSESEKSDKSENEAPSGEAKEERSDPEEKEEVDTSSDSADEGSDIDLADDVDVEIDAGDIESLEDPGEKPEEGSEKEEEQDRKKAKKQSKKKTKSKADEVQRNKPSIKSRLGLRAVEEVAQQAQKDRRGNTASRARSVKERLGLKLSSLSDPSGRAVRGGVIQLNKARDDRETFLGRREIRRKDAVKDILLVPKITIHNEMDMEDRKLGIKQRLGLLDSEERGKKRKKMSMDEELFRLLQEEDVDIEKSELELLTKKEKKKILKKLLAQQGREDEYEEITGRRKKRKGTKKKRERSEDEEEEEKEERRRINIQSRLGPSPESGAMDSAGEEELVSGDEIELEEEQKEEEDHPENNTEEQVEEADKGPEEPATEDAGEQDNSNDIPVKSLESIRKEKEARLREAMEPKTLEDIRKERRLKKLTGGGDADSALTTAPNKGRRIVLADEEKKEEKNEPQVKITFGGGDPFTKRKLIRVGENAEQNENTRPGMRVSKGFKRERQIYVPPSVKRVSPTTVGGATQERVKKPPGPPSGREIIDYGEMFPKKKTLTSATEKCVINTVKAPSPSLEVAAKRSPVKLQRGPPKVEVKDAQVKTFAEIMAEKKRKRLEAQQGNKSTFRPIVFDDSDQPDSGPSSQENKMKTDLRSRLSPLERSSSPASGKSQSPTMFGVTKISTKPVLKRDNTIAASESADSVLSKPSRWKRRKTNESVTADVQVSKSEDNILSRDDNDDLLLLDDDELDTKSEMSSSTPGAAFLFTSSADSDKTIPKAQNKAKSNISEEPPQKVTQLQSNVSVEKKTAMDLNAGINNTAVGQKPVKKAASVSAAPVSHPGSSSNSSNTPVVQSKPVAKKQPIDVKVKKATPGQVTMETKPTQPVSAIVSRRKSSHMSTKVNALPAASKKSALEDEEDLLKDDTSSVAMETEKVKKNTDLDTSTEKKKKASDSFLDFDDDLLAMDDEDLDLGDSDSDDLMREIDDLLS